MVARAVEAVWVWYVGDAAFKATYGRYDDDADRSWTKDYLQVSGKCRDLLAEKFPEKGGTDRADITYQWPGNNSDGFIKFSADRHHLSWKTVNGAPDPWRLTPQPTMVGPQTLPGDPTANNTAAANDAFSDFKALGISAYLVAVKLHGEEGVLHIRTYVRNPNPALEFANLCLLPEVIQQVAAKAIPSRACSSIDLGSGGSALTPALADIIARLLENPNLLLVGPPGTGKTVLLEQLAEYLENPGAGVLFDPDKNHEAWSEGAVVTVPGKTRTVVLHPSYSYDNLVLGLMPVPSKKGVEIRVATGPLINLAHYASAGGNRALLIVDEFNRGNASAILGDTLALLDKDKRGTATIDLAYGDLEINVPAEFAAKGNTSVSSRLTLPPNLWIVAAMNSSDRSVAPLDAALRRRFSIVEMPPDYNALATHIGASGNADFAQAFDDWSAGDIGQLAVDLLRAVNDRIDAVLGQDFRLGQSNFWHVTGASAFEALNALAIAWDTRVLQTLRLALQDNDDALAAIIKAGTASQAISANTTRAAWWKRADEELGTYGQARLHFNDMEDLEPSAALGELRRLAGK